MISKAYGAGEGYPHQILGQPIYAAPGSACTETYVVVHPCDSAQICANVMRYMRTRLFRFLVHLKKATQDATRGVYEFVPQQDFSRTWTDGDLYRMYALTDEEIAFIEAMIRPMPERP